MATSSARNGVIIPVSDDTALIFLLELYRYAVDLGVWDLAIEMRSLPALNLTDSDLRWLMKKQLVEHGHRRILSGTRYFMLTEKGADLIRRLEAVGRAPHFCPGRASSGNGTLPNGTSAQDGLPTPCWDCHRQELRLGNHVIKQFKIPSVDQEIVLAAFEEENWPSRIDDPFCGQQESDATHRLQSSIDALNRNQKRPLMRFRLDSSGQGICCERLNNIS